MHFTTSIDVFEEETKTGYNTEVTLVGKLALVSDENGDKCKSSTVTLLTKQIERKKVSHLSSGVQVANGIGFKVTFILPAQHSCDDDDNQGDHCDGGQHCGDYPKVVRRVLDHGWDKEEQMCTRVQRKPPKERRYVGESRQLPARHTQLITAYRARFKPSATSPSFPLRFPSPFPLRLRSSVPSHTRSHSSF